MKKSSKTILIGFIVLWSAVFIFMWGKSLFKKGGISLSSIVSKNKAAGKAWTEAMPGGEGQEASEAVPVRCYKVSLMDFKDDLPVMGTIKGGLEIPLKFEINGVIESINFREGDMVSEGETIASLNKKDALLKVEYSKAKMDAAKTQALAAKKKYELHKSLYEVGGIIKAKLEEVELEAKSAEEQAKSAEVELKSAEAELKKTGLIALREGVMGAREAEVGEFVTPNNKIATLYDVTEVFAELGIVEKDMDKVALGQDVMVTVDAHAGSIFKGKVDYIYPAIEGKSRTLTVKARIQNPDIQLLPGMFTRALITVAEFENAMVIPSLSLNKKDEGYTVSVIDNQNTVRIKPVNVEYVTTDYSVIASGISEGELVATESPQELKDGMPVQVIEVQENTSPGNN